ncbi:MAG: glycosyltransferase family 4 protein [Candidatus Sericytochromatia bacterium]
MQPAETAVIPQLARRFVFAEWGGTETVVWNSARQLQRVGVRSDILATRALSPVAQESRDGVQIQRFDYHYPYWGLSRQGQQLLDKKGGNPFVPELERHLNALPRLDLIHCHGMQRLAALARRVARRRGVPYVVSFHGGRFEVPEAEITQMRAPVAQSFHYGRLLDPWYGTARALADADGLICVGHGEYLRTREAFPDKPVIYLPNGVAPEAAEQGDVQRFRAQLGLAPHWRLLLCVGRLDPQKNQLALLEMLPHLPADTALVLIGPPTDPAYYQQLLDTRSALGLQPRAWIIPGLAPDDPLLADAYAAAELFVLPSRHEPFGIVVLEAWMRRKPVVVADVGGLRHLVENGVNGLRFQDATEMRHQVRTLLDQPLQARALGARGHAEARQRYSWETLVDQLQAFYAEVQQRHRQRTAGKF